MIINSARFLLFGPKVDADLSLQSIVVRKAVNLGRQAMGMPPNKGPGFKEWLIQQGKLLIARFFGYDDNPKLPDDMPVKLWQTVDSVLRQRGGTDKATDTPFYWCDAKDCTSTPFFWSLVVSYNPHSDPGKVNSFELALEDQLSRAGYDYNVRIQSKPMRIEVDKPKPPTVTLKQLWPVVAEGKTNERRATLGTAYKNGTTGTLTITMVGEDFSAFVAGSPGSGKTQLCMAMLLSMAYSNAPDSLAMVIIDPKAIDFRPFNALPHLALPVITEPSYAAEVVQSLCDEMDKRTRQAAKGDTSFLANSILLYVDELADLLNSLPGEQASALATNLQRLAQKGRGVGFVVVGCTQRVYDIPASCHSKLNMRLVGKMRTANDSVSASGIPGTTTNKLPGRGSFELWTSDLQGVRIQAPFVADSSKPGYEKALQPFFADITQRWQDSRPGWSVGQQEAPTVAPAAPLGDEADERPVSTPAIEIDPALLTQLQEEYADDPEGFTGRTVRRCYTQVYGKQMDGNKAKRIFEQFIQTVAINNDASGVVVS